MTPCRIEAAVSIALVTWLEYSNVGEIFTEQQAIYSVSRMHPGNAIDSLATAAYLCRNKATMRGMTALANHAVPHYRKDRHTRQLWSGIDLLRQRSVTEPTSEDDVS